MLNAAQYGAPLGTPPLGISATLTSTPRSAAQYIDPLTSTPLSAARYGVSRLLNLG